MKKIKPILLTIFLLASLFIAGITPAKAQIEIPDGFFDSLYLDFDLCAEYGALYIGLPETVEGYDGFGIGEAINPQDFSAGIPFAPEYHTDGRLNFMVCRAPLAVYLNEDGSIEVWSTDESNLYVPLDLKVTATAEEIAAAIAEALETGMNVVVAGYVDGFALIATPDGTLKAELIGIYGFEFNPDGSGNNGWGLNYEDQWGNMMLFDLGDLDENLIWVILLLLFSGGGVTP